MIGPFVCQVYEHFCSSKGPWWILPHLPPHSVLSVPAEVTTNLSAWRQRRQGCSGNQRGKHSQGSPKIRPSPCTRTSPPAPACVPVPGWLSAGESFVRFTLLLLHCFIYIYLNLCLSFLPSPPPLHPLFSLVSCFLLSQTGDWAMPGCAGPGMVLGGQWKGPGDPWPTPARATAFCLLA